MIFLWIFLPAVLGGNFILSLIPFQNRPTRIKAKNIFLLCASLFFYAWGGIYYLLIMLASILINYTGGQLIVHRCQSQKAKQFCLTVTVILNLLILFVFKYFNMAVIIIENLISKGGSINRTSLGSQLPSFISDADVIVYEFVERRNDCLVPDLTSLSSIMD